MFRVLGRIMKKEFIQTFRDKRILFIVLVAPILQNILFGLAVNLDLTAQPVSIADMDRTEASRALVKLLENNSGFKIVNYTTTYDEAENDVLLGRASLAMLIPKGFSDDKDRGAAELLAVLDGSDSNTSLRVGQELAQILTDRTIRELRSAMEVRLAALGVPADVLPKIKIIPRAWFNPRMRSAVFFVPGVLALVLTVITMMLTSLGLTREKEIGTLEQIMVSPTKSWELIIGKTLPFAIMGLADVVLIMCVAAWIFDIPTMGPIWALIGAGMLFFMTTLGMGLFISTISNTQQQAMMNSFFFMMPAMMLSGFVFPIENMPEPVQWLTYANPLRYFIQLVRGIMVKGAGPEDIWPQALMLAIMGILVLSAASMRFRKRLA